MEILQLARELCAELQKDERYLDYVAARDANDADEDLQNKIGEFNLVRMSLDNELAKEKRDEGKIKELNEKLRRVYTAVMDTEAMINYNNKKQALDELIGKIDTLISKTCNGEDPLTCEISHSCGGSCSSCGGCH